MPPIVSYPSTSPQQYEMQTPPLTSMAAPMPTPTPTPNIPTTNNAFCASLLPRETDKLATSGVKTHFNSKPIGFPPQGNMLSNMHAKTARKSAFVETARSGYASSSSGSRKSGSGSSSAAVAAKKDNKRDSNDIRESPKGIVETVAKFSNNEGVGASADQKKHSLSVPQTQTKIPPGFFKRSADIAHPASSSPPVTSHPNSEPKPKRQKIATAKAAAMASVANMNLDKPVVKKRKPRQKKEKRADTPKRGKDSEKKEPEKAKNVAGHEKELSEKSKDAAQAKGTGVFTLSRSPVAENSETPTTYHTNESGIMPPKQRDLGPIPNPPQPDIHFQLQRKQTPDAIKQALQLQEKDKRKRDSAPIPPPVPRVSQEMPTLSNISAEAVASNGSDVEKQLHSQLSHQLPTYFASRGQEDVISISDSESPILPPKKSRGLEDVKQFGNKATPITIEDSCEEGDDDDISMGEAGSGIPEKAAPATTLNGELATVGTPDAQNYINHDFFAQICPDYAGDKELLFKIQRVENTVRLLLDKHTENNLELKGFEDYFQSHNHSDNLQDRIAFLFNKVGVLTTDGQIVKFEEWKMGGRETFEGTPILLDYSKLWMGQKKDSTGYEARAAEKTEVDPAKAPPSPIEGNVQQETQRVFDQDIPMQLGDGEVADPVADAAKELEVGVCVMDVDDARKDSAPTNEKTGVNHRNRTKDELDELDLEGRTLTTQKHLTPPSAVDSTMSDVIKQFDLPIGVSITETHPVVPGTSPSQAASVEQAQPTIAACDLPLDFNMAPCSIVSGKTPRKTFGKARPRIEDVFREPPHAESTRQRRQSILTTRQQQRDDPLLAKIAVLDRQERAIRAQLEKMVLHAKKTGQEMEKKIAELWQPLTATADGDEPQDKDPNLPASLCGPAMDYEGSLEAVKKRRKLQDEKRDFEEDTTRQQVKLLQKAIEISDEKNLAMRKRKLEMEEVSSTSHGRYYLPCNGTPSVSTPGTPSVAGTSSTESGNVLGSFHPLLFGYPGESTGQTLFRELVQWAKEPSTPSQSASPALPTSATTSQPPKKKKPIRKKKNW